MVGIQPHFLHFLLIGDPTTGITDFAASHGCSQIVIGTRGHSGLPGTLLGSVAMKLVHHAKVPVLLVRLSAVAAAPTLSSSLASKGSKAWQSSARTELLSS